MTEGIDCIGIDRAQTIARVWALRENTVVWHTTCDPKDLSSVIADRTNHSPATAIICGESSASCVNVPIKPAELPLVRAQDIAPGVQTYFVPGLKQHDENEQSHGLETRIAGFLSINPGWDGVVCLPGMRTSWVQISADEIISIQSFVSLLIRDAMEPVLHLPPQLGNWDNEAFVSAVGDTLSRPEALAAKLARLPSNGSHEHLNGYLIGAELAAARPWWLGQQIAVIGPEDDSRMYCNALMQQGTPVLQTDEARMTLAGLTGYSRSLFDKKNNDV